METIHIEVAQNKYQSAKEARRAGDIPMVCYSNGKETTQYTVEYQNFRKAFLKAGKSAIITLSAEGKDLQDVIVHEVQYAPVSDDIIHVDLKVIDASQKISTDIPLIFVGEAAAVRELGGTFVSNKDKVHIECLPKDLPHEIEVDISSLVDFHTSLTVGDIKVSDKITILDAPEISIAVVSAPREEEVETEAPVAPEAPVITTEKKTEEGENKGGEKK